MNPGDCVQYGKYHGKILFCLDKDIYVIELYNYRGFTKICKHIPENELYYQSTVNDTL